MVPDALGNIEIRLESPKKGGIENLGVDTWDSGLNLFLQA